MHTSWCNIQSWLSSWSRSFNFQQCKSHTLTLTGTSSCVVTRQPCPLWLHHSHHLKISLSQWTHRTMSCWVALIETAYVYSKQKEGWRHEAREGEWQNSKSKCASSTTHTWPTGLLSHTHMHRAWELHSLRTHIQSVLNAERYDFFITPPRVDAFYVTRDICEFIFNSTVVIKSISEQKGSSDISMPTCMNCFMTPHEFLDKLYFLTFH